ncbi:MAG: hypothetical protein EAZ30_09575 [Betaproteobacteria bacterium]|nr:MAG: hypothetical protein EAZ30_09575 [Betaproteobacteria bacterium]
MDALHFVLAFNLSTCLVILVGCYVLSLRYDEHAEKVFTPSVNFASLAGAALSLGLLGGVATMFI